MTRHSPFRSFVRTRYHEMGKHQYHLAEELGVDGTTVGRWLAGTSRMSNGDLEHLATWLELSKDERSWMMLAHDLLHAGDRVLRYVESLENDRFGNDICDQRIEKLHQLLGELHGQRAVTRHIKPIVYRPGVRLENDDDETHGKSGGNTRGSKPP